jgi:hypothetical protein
MDYRDTLHFHRTDVYFLDRFGFQVYPCAKAGVMADHVLPAPLGGLKLAHVCIHERIPNRERFELKYRIDQKLQALQTLLKTLMVKRTIYLASTAASLYQTRSA